MLGVVMRGTFAMARNNSEIGSATLSHNYIIVPGVSARLTALGFRVHPRYGTTSYSAAIPALSVHRPPF